MSDYIVSARKYRPQVFDDVIGQQAIANTLRRAIVNQKLAGAYLFCGPRGVGKTTCARIFAKSINCLNPKENGDACDECESCKSFNEGRSVNVQELNAAANNSVDDIRAIIDQVRIPPQIGRYKVIILDEVHMLSQSASNALLKTLEEPPSYVVFVLATTEKQKIMPTILSRCQIFDFNRMEVDNIIMQLKSVADSEGIVYEERALNVIAQKADGGMRDSLSIFDQVASFSGGNITMESVLRCLNVLDYDYYFKMTDCLVEHKVSDAMLLFNDVVSKGFDGGVFIGGLASHMRDLLVCRNEATISLLDVANNVKDKYAEQSKKCSPNFLYRSIRMCDTCANGYKTSFNKRLSVEITLIEVAQIGLPDPADGTPGSGHGPTSTLKPIFKLLTVERATPPASAKANTIQYEKPVSQKETPKVESPKSDPKVVTQHGFDPSILLQDSISIIPAISKPKVEPAQNSPVQEQKIDAKVELAGELKENEFTDSMLSIAWTRFVKTIVDDPSLKGRLEGMVPEKDSDSQVLLRVNGSHVVPMVESLRNDIENFLRKQLENNKIQLNVAVKELHEQTEILTPRKCFEKYLEENQNLAKLHKKLEFKVE